MRLNNFDLNLLIALQALIEERSVTRAATRLHLSQPAMSAALRRLREQFNDDILVSHGKRMFPTSHAQALKPQVEQALSSMQALITRSAVFVPSTSSRVFRIAASDYVTTVLLIPLIAQLESEAPHIRLEIENPSGNVLSMLEMGKLDFVVTPERFLAPNHPKHLLFEENHVVVGWDRNPVFEQEVTEEVFYRCGHIVAEFGGEPSYVEAQLRELGDRRRIEIVAPSFTVVPWMLPGTKRVAMMHERLARIMVDKLPLKIAPLPFHVAPMREMIQFHEARTNDGGLQWLLAKILNAAKASHP